MKIRVIDKNLLKLFILIIFVILQIIFRPR